MYRTGGLFTVRYDQIEGISYEYTNKHRVKEAVVLGLVSPWGAGAIIGMTKSRNHWLEIDFRDQEGSRALVLKMDKSDYRTICNAAKTHTGKEVAEIGKTDLKTIQGKAKK